jgi:hypothetical protein
MRSVENIREGFLLITIAKQPGLPNYKTIADFHLKLKANAASVPSKIGGGDHGLLGLVLPPATYTMLTNIVSQAPVNPGTVPAIPGGATGNQINEIVRQHAKLLRVWREYQATDQALRQQLLITFNEAYIRGLRNWHTAYNNVSAMQLLMHLYNTYGVIRPIDIKDNDTGMREPFDPTLPIATLFDQIESAVTFADAGNPTYNPEQVVSRAYLLILQPGMYPDACCDWRPRDLVDQTWPNFKASFS